MNDDYVDSNMQNHDGGKRKPRTKKRRTQKNAPKIIVGKIYANWCGHCKALKPEWKKMRKIVKGKSAGKCVQVVDISEDKMDVKLAKLNETHGVQIVANGYPTLFKLVNGKVEYYEGSREALPLAEWAMKGGEPQDTMPNLFADVQGGKRTIHTRKIAKTRTRSGFLERLFGYKA
jgi:thiol-disulfide isomerase/thioredoxin